MNAGVCHRHVDIQSGEHKKEPVISINPFGQIPAFVSEDEKVKLFESRAIARYLDFTAGGKLLRTSDAAAYGKVESWAAVEVSTFSKHFQTLLFELVIAPLFFKKATNQASVDAAKAEAVKLLEVYEKHLTTSAFLASNDVSIADLFHIPLLAPVALQAIPDLLTPFPHVKAWLDKLVALPAWQEVAKEQQQLLASFAASQQEKK